MCGVWSPSVDRLGSGLSYPIHVIASVRFGVSQQLRRDQAHYPADVVASSLKCSHGPNAGVLSKRPGPRCEHGGGVADCSGACATVNTPLHDSAQPRFSVPVISGVGHWDTDNTVPALRHHPIGVSLAQAWRRSSLLHQWRLRCRRQGWSMFARAGVACTVAKASRNSLSVEPAEHPGRDATSLLLVMPICPDYAAELPQPTLAIS
jgi:hypothetical protein